MAKLFVLGILLSGSLLAAQNAPPPPAENAQPNIGDLSPQAELRGKTMLVRGILKRLDPIHDQLLVRAFGGSDLRIAFDTRTELMQGNSRTQVRNIPAGSTISVDAVVEGGKLFARSVRITEAQAAELSGQVVRYDGSRSRLLLHDASSPEPVTLHVSSSTVVVNRGQPASLQALAPGMLVRVQFVPAQNAATNVEILAERGNDFTFAGRVMSVDLRTHLVALSNESDKTVREVSVASLDPTSLRLLRDGVDVSIQAEFDGDRYNARSVTLLSNNK